MSYCTLDPPVILHIARVGAGSQLIAYCGAGIGAELVYPERVTCNECASRWIEDRSNGKLYPKRANQFRRVVQRALKHKKYEYTPASLVHAILAWYAENNSSDFANSY